MLVRASDPNASVKDLLLLDFEGPDHLIWIVLNSLYFCWNNRRVGKIVLVQDLFNTLKYDLEILMSSIHSTLATEVLNVVTQYERNS